MKDKDCSCDNFEELRGASVNGYISAFLEPAKNNKNSFVCKICGTIWGKQKSDDATKMSLLKINTLENQK